MRVTIAKTIEIAAAHRLWGGPEGAKHCIDALHGHNWEIRAHAVVDVNLDGPDNHISMLYGDIKNDLYEHVHDLFDHKTMNDISPFHVINPTTENFAAWILERLRTVNDRYFKVEVWESKVNYACAEWYG